MASRGITKLKSKRTIIGGPLIGTKSLKATVDISKLIKTVKTDKNIRSNLSQTRRKVKQRFDAISI